MPLSVTSVVNFSFPLRLREEGEGFKPCCLLETHHDIHVMHGLPRGPFNKIVDDGDNDQGICTGYNL